MEIILDTNAVSALADCDRTAAEQLELTTLVGLPVIVLGEWLSGVKRSRKRLEYEKWLPQLIRLCTVLNVDKQTAEHYAEIKDALKQRGRPIPENDIWIAALCMQHSMPLMTKDRHFDQIAGLRRVDW